MRHLKLFESKDKDRLIDVEINDSRRSVEISIKKKQLLRRSRVGGVTYNDPMSVTDLAKFYKSVSNLWEMITELINRTEDHFDCVEVTDSDFFIFIRFYYIHSK